MAAFRDLAINLMGEKCYDNYLVEMDFFDVDCFKVLLSKGLGIGIIAGSILVKVPQILKIYGNKSAAGLNFLSVLLDLFAITCHMSYSAVRGFPFSAWGDSSFLAIQTVAIAVMILFYGGAPLKAVAFGTFYVCIVYALNFMTPIDYLLVAQGFNVPVLFVGKMTQAFTNYQNGSTGQLSAATCFMLFFGSLARIFTSIQETGDTMMVLTYSVSTFANSVIVGQLLYYWNVDKDGKKETKPKQKTKTKAKKAD